MEDKDKTLVEKLVEAEERGREAGIKEVVEWIEHHSSKPYYRHLGNLTVVNCDCHYTWDEWQAKLKEWGIDEI